MHLTDARIRALKAGPATAEISDGLQPGLRLVVHPAPSTVKSWICRYRFGGRQRKLTLGRYPSIGLKDARQRAGKAMADVGDGIDPATAKAGRKAAEREAETTLFSTIAGRFLALHVEKHNSRPTIVAQRAMIEMLKPIWGKRPIASISKIEVRGLLGEIAETRGPVAANRTRSRLARLFNWAVAHDYVAVSPVAGIAAPAKETPRERVLDDAELLRILLAADQLDPAAAGFVRMLVYTGQRRTEVSALSWPELDLERAEWTLPASRSKNRRSHVVPLSGPAMQILAERPRIIGRGQTDAVYVFTRAGRPLGGFHEIKQALDQAIAEDGGPPMAAFVFHDIRRSAVTGLARLGVALPVIERLVNHHSGSFAGVAGVYQRHGFVPEMRAAVDAWATHLQVLLARRQGANVVPMRTA